MKTVKLSIARFWREKESHYRLKAVKCRSCGRISYPPGSVCRYCGSKDLEEIELMEPGRVLTWAVIHTAPEGFDEYKPIIIAMVELVNSKVRVLTQLTDIDPDEIKPGMLVEPVLRRIVEDGESGLIYYGIKFRPMLEGLVEK